MSQPLKRAAAILEAVASTPTGLTVAAIAVETMLPTPTAHRMVRSLAKLGLLDGQGRGALYRLGPRLLGLARGGDVPNRTRIAAKAILTPIANRLGAVGFLTRLVGGQVDTVVQVIPEAPLGPVVLPGSSLPLHATASGKVFLAAMEETALAPILSRKLTRYGPGTIVDATRLRQELAAVRKRGYASCLSEYDTGVFSLAVPVADSERPAAFALGAVGFESAMLSRHSEAGLARLLRKSASELAKSAHGRR